MKITNLLTLLAATSAFALNFKRDDQLNQLEQILGAAQSQQNTQGSGNMDAASAFACLGTLTNFLDKCYGIAMNEKTLENLEAAAQNIDCKLINSDGCQSALKDLSNSKCGNEKLDSATPYMNMYCAVDENGSPCPISAALQKSMDNPEAAKDDKDTLTYTDIENTCKSSKCTEAAINAMNELKKNGMAPEDEVDTYIKTLSSDTCKAAASTVAGNANTANNANTSDNAAGSGATQIKVGSALLATLALALYFF